jgi:hypothetical protein
MIRQFWARSPLRASRVDIVPPGPAADRAGLAICAIMRNEERHIGDWLRFHAAAGVLDFYLYDNLSTDDTIAAARAVRGVRTTILPWRLSTTSSKPKMIIPQQIMAYCHAICTFGSAHRWMAFIDIDELLLPQAAQQLSEALRPLEVYSNISLPWVMFGPSGHDDPPDEPAAFAYLERAERQEGALLNFKCIVDPCKVSQVSVHKFRTLDMGEKSANDAGVVAQYKQRSGRGFMSNKNIQLNHYYTRSRSELESKVRGGGVSGVDNAKREDAIRRKVALIGSSTVRDTAAINFLLRKGIASGSDLRSFVPVQSVEDQQ